jgi:hypothetical protein
MARDWKRERAASLDENSLGRLLLDHQPPLITREQLWASLDEAALYGWPVGKALVKRGYVKQETLDQLLRRQNARREKDPLKRACISLAMADRALGHMGDALTAHAQLAAVAKA